MTRQQQRTVEAFRSRSYFGGMGGLGIESDQITNSVGSGLLAAAPLSGPAAPFLAAAGALTKLIGGLFHPDMTKVEATNIVNRIEAEYMKPNLAAWQALPANQKTQSAQAAAENVFNQAWNMVVQACSQASLGQAGVNCIGDRARGGKVSWFSYYLDPIANDPNVIPDPSPLASAGSFLNSLTGGSTGGGIPTPLLIGAALLIAAFMMGRD